MCVLKLQSAWTAEFVPQLRLADEKFLGEIPGVAERIGDNILERKFEDGFFRPSKKHIYTRFDRPVPLALLMLEAGRQGEPQKVPPYLTGHGSTDGEPDNGGRPSDEA